AAHRYFRKAVPVYQSRFAALRFGRAGESGAERIRGKKLLRRRVAGYIDAGRVHVTKIEKYFRSIRIAGIQVSAPGSERQSRILGINVSEHIRAGLQHAKREAGRRIANL